MKLSAYAALTGLAVIAAVTSTNTAATIAPNEVKPEQNYKVRASWNWGLRKLDSDQAWKLTRGNKKIVVAIIDTGVDMNHPDLKANLWTNPKEAPNGIDDDGNGLIDDIHGWNFVDNDDDISDRHGHGTHIAGIIGANGPSLQGVAPEVSLMILKYFDPKSANQNPLTNTVNAIRYAVRMGADIINYSGGGLASSREEYDAISEASEAGILFVAAAGNEKSDSDKRSYYPADYLLPNILSVTAIDPRAQVLPSSNWGENTVDIAAPGEDIFSTLPGGEHGYMTGTSQATAFATGVAVLVKASHPELRTPSAVIKHLLETGEFARDHAGKTRSRTTLNSYRALAMKPIGTDANGNAIEAKDGDLLRFSF
ncbi:MAG TPA: S8 family peptidase [Bdellovibrionales bacterium]|nr:S8 family peptidase [Bdellovibrionales bacterium]